MMRSMMLTNIHARVVCIEVQEGASFLCHYQSGCKTCIYHGAPGHVLLLVMGCLLKCLDIVYVWLGQLYMDVHGRLSGIGSTAKFDQATHVPHWVKDIPMGMFILLGDEHIRSWRQPGTYIVQMTRTAM